MKPRAIYFYQYLPPWRIDVFNEIAKHYELTIVFTNADLEGFTYNRQYLLSKLKNIETIFLNNGFKIGSRPVRFGIYKIIKRINPDVVFSHEYPPTGIFAAIYRKRFKYKYIVTTSDNLRMAENVKGFKALVRRYILGCSQGLVVYSKSVKRWYECKFPKLQVEVCPNIQNPKSLLEYRCHFPPIIEDYNKKLNLKDKKIILYVGRLVHVKGLDLLLDAISEINYEYKLVLVGNGELEYKLKLQAQKLGIMEKVIFAGSYSGANLYAWYEMANFLILPSRYEPFGAVINEALIYGCPVVASKYVGALDFITSKNGIVFDPLNKENFIEVLEDACKIYTKNGVRKNLMIYSFEEYVKVFNKF